MKPQKGIDIKEYLIGRSEQLVDLTDQLDEAIEQNNEDKSKELVEKLNDIGNELVDLIPNLNGDDMAYASFMMGSLCNALRYWSDAASAFERSLKIWPDHVGMLNEYFVALYHLGRFDEAVSTMEKSIEIGGETPDVIQNLAVALASAGNSDKAKVVLFNGMAKFPYDQQIRESLKQLEKLETHGH